MNEVELILGINPVACPRPRVTRWGTYYTPKYEKFKKDMEVLLSASKVIEKLEGPIAMQVHFFMPMAKSWSKKKKESHRCQWHQQKPDIDNLIKALLDALNGHLFDDDCQVVSVHAEKVWDNEGEIIFRAWEEEEL